MAKLVIKEKKQRPLLGRTELTAELNYDGATPKTQAVQEMVAKAINHKEELVIIKGIRTIQGQQKAMISAEVYDTADHIQRLGYNKPKDNKKGAAAKKG